MLRNFAIFVPRGNAARFTFLLVLECSGFESQPLLKIYWAVGGIGRRKESLNLLILVPLGMLEGLHLLIEN